MEKDGKEKPQKNCKLKLTEVNNTILNLAKENSELDYLSSLFLQKDITIANCYKETKESYLQKAKGVFGGSKDVKFAKERLTQIENIFGPIILQLNDFIKSELGGTTKSTMPKLELEENLCTAEIYLSKFVDGLESSKPKLEEVFRKIRLLVKIHFGLWKSIETYEETKTGEVWKSKMTGVFEIFKGAGNEVDVETKHKAPKVEFYTQAEILLMEYEVIKRAFLQWAFPYAEVYLREVRSEMENVENLLAGKVEGDIGESKDGKDKISQGIEDITKIVTHFNNIYTNSISVVTSLNENIMRESFLNMFKWKYSQHGAQIKELFKGKPVKKASVMQESTKKAAVKVNGDLDLWFLYSGKDVNNEHKDDLEECKLVMIHSGESVYRVGEIFYSISNSEPIKLQGSIKFGKEAQEMEVKQQRLINETREIIVDFALSPSTEWTFQFVLRNPDKYKQNDFFTNLYAKFTDAEISVDLKLVGTAKYLDEQDIIGGESLPCNLNHYYKIY